MSGATGRLVFEGVGKRFRRGERVDTLRDLVPGVMRGLLRGGRARRSAEPFWALRDVSFEIEPGRVLGIIGPNGAGKSTVLKLATGLMLPSEGRIEVTGRVGALIEIAAGFHPELTGRENVFLQGAVMGMRRAEVARRFDEIVAFAELEEFISTPVKRYSSGMNARLGFSIAAHLDPDVLLIDEVLAVGDLAFQRKAIARIAEVVDRDIPVLIVSHQLQHIARLCDEAILLGRGSVVARGEPLSCIAQYAGGAYQPSMEEGECGWTQIDGDSVRPATLGAGETLNLTVDGLIRESGVEVGLQIRSLPDGGVVYAAYSSSCGVEVRPGEPFRLDVELDMNLGPGVYGISPYLLDSQKQWERWRGRMVTVEVARSRPAYGGVDLNARMVSREP